VAFEDLRITGEEKDASILELRQAAETTRANLEMEKQVEGKSPQTLCLSIGLFRRDSL
jgi:hypothetical protein